jgi:hypothetical protein
MYGLCLCRDLHKICTETQALNMDTMSKFGRLAAHLHERHLPTFNVLSV